MELESKADYAYFPNSMINFEERDSNVTNWTKTQTSRSEALTNFI